MTLPVRPCMWKHRYTVPAQLHALKEILASNPRAQKEGVASSIAQSSADSRAANSVGFVARHVKAHRPVNINLEECTDAGVMNALLDCHKQNYLRFWFISASRPSMFAILPTKKAPTIPEKIIAMPPAATCRTPESSSQIASTKSPEFCNLNRRILYGT